MFTHEYHGTRAPQERLTRITRSIFIAAFVRVVQDLGFRD